jgi:MFS transporter, FHS family, Na+ dependent glucose transporter 1
VPVSSRLSPKTILWIDLIGCGLSMLIIVMLPGVQAALWIGTLLLGFSMASIFPTALTLADKRLHISGKITSWFFIGASLGGMVLPWVIGQVFEPLGPPAAMVLIFGDVLITILLFFFIK